MLAIFKILADPTRLRLLRVLSHGDFTVQDLTRILEMGQSRISRHLKLMTDAGLLSIDRQGTWHYYRLAPSNELFQRLWPLIAERFKELEGDEADLAGVSRLMVERRQRSQEFFERHAQDWDRIHQDMLKLPEYRRQLLDLIPHADLIVELGVGTGQLLSDLAAKGSHVIGIDHAPAMVEKARELANRTAPAKVEVRLAEMTHLPLPDSSGDVVVMNQVLHHAEVPLQVLQETVRVLQPGGRLILADLTRHGQDWVREHLADQWLGFCRKETDAWLNEAGLELQDYFEIGAKTQHKVFLLTAVCNKQ